MNELDLDIKGGEGLCGVFMAKYKLGYLRLAADGHITICRSLHAKCLPYYDLRVDMYERN